MNSTKSSSSILTSIFSSGVSIPIYNNKNFIIWESRIKAYLRAVKAIKAIEEDVPIDEMTSEDIEADDIAKGVIIEHVNDLLMLTLNSYARAYDMFDSIRQRHRASAKQREAYLVDELYSKKMSDDDSLTSHLDVKKTVSVNMDDEYDVDDRREAETLISIYRPVSRLF
ncbi:hypothetical protein V1507DRAFT_445370 [Lipomyces tetrasporus]